ncbi:HAD family phosphatase [Clostridium sp. SYSU_GA19001]|uniref:HAD family hydrolase n=1 Tax=Clostridium caldaquaticum TaxID=2940653 RepID=UPI002076E262|nr:HAD family phosphatase [Clostridium caldaquaticum]MCM8711405.1 HAD family phosphatase [Clostridium caldaquaticum]
MLKAVIFDMDGVIFDSELVHAKLEKSLLKEMGVDLTHEEIESFVGTSSYYMWEMLKGKYGLSKTVEELVKIERDSYFELLVSENHEDNIVKGVKELIQELHKNKVKLAVASSSPVNVIDTVVDMYDIRQYFNALVSGDYVERSKPNPDIFLYAAEKLGVKPEECIVIEDSSNGVLAAKRAEMKCIGYRNVNSGKQDLSPADLVISDYSEISYEKLKELCI